MKKLYTTLVAVLAIIQISYGQWTGGPTGSISYSNGNVGIGTATPSTLLHVLGTSEQLRLGYSSSLYTSFNVDNGGNLTIQPSQNLTVTGVNPTIVINAPSGNTSALRMMSGTSGSVADYTLRSGLGSTNSLSFINK